MIVLTFDGRPVPWSRVKRGKGGKPYTPKKQKDHRESLAWAIKAAANGKWFRNYPVRLEVEFDYKTNRTVIKLTHESETYRSKRPDLDNLVKQVLEAIEMSGVVEDDAQVVYVVARKV